MDAIVPVKGGQLQAGVPEILIRAGANAVFAAEEFFKATINNAHTKRRLSKASPALSKVTVVILKSASFGANLNEGHEQHSKHEGQNEKGTRHDYTGGICPNDSCL